VLLSGKSVFCAGRKMRRGRRRLLWLVISILGVPGFPVISQGQAPPDEQEAVPLITDWSYQHVIFSRPSTPEQTARVEQDVRYWQQLYRRQMAMTLPSEQSGLSGADWAQNMGSGASVGAGNYPAKFSFSLTTANCSSAIQPDFTVYNTGLAGSGARASIVAYDNLYSGCVGTVPTVYWAYNTGARIATSPVISFDGKQVGFVQTLGGTAKLTLLKWVASSTETVTSPGAPTLVTLASYPTCTAPCMTSVTLKDSLGTAHDDTLSSVFYVYNQDTAYVGDSAGWLHQFTGVFKGTPAEKRTGGWPVHVNPLTSKALGVAVHDAISGNTFVEDAGGFLYRVSSTAVVTASGQLDFSTRVTQGPIVDPTVRVVYVFASSDGSGTCTGGANCSSVDRLVFGFAAGATGTKKKVGVSTLTGTTPNPFYIGAFDSTYLNSGSATGNLYVCANTGGPPTLYRIAVAGGALGSVTAGPVVATSTTPCSPVTDVQNPNAAGGTTEWIFASAAANGIATPCAGGCLFNFKNTPWKPSTAYVLGQEVLDTKFQIQVVTTAGTSGSTTPAWNTTARGVTNDGTVKWFNQGLTTQVTTAAWAANTIYPVGSTILDSNNNIELSTATSGNKKSGATQPVWNTTVGGTRVDNHVTWTNVGPVSASALASAGGSSGTIFDNFVPSTTLAGASQVYFSTLSNQTCGTTGTGGCAMQASQAALK
jgi:hypothetical protein